MGITRHLSTGADNDLYTDFHDLFTGLCEEANRRDAEDDQKQQDERRKQWDDWLGSETSYQPSSTDLNRNRIEE